MLSYPHIKNGRCHYRDAGFFNVGYLRIKRSFALSTYITHTPIDYHRQKIMIRTVKGKIKALSAIGHFQTFERILNAHV